VTGLVQRTQLRRSLDLDFIGDPPVLPSPDHESPLPRRPLYLHLAPHQHFTSTSPASVSLPAIAADISYHRLLYLKSITAQHYHPEHNHINVFFRPLHAPNHLPSALPNSCTSTFSFEIPGVHKRSIQEITFNKVQLTSLIRPTLEGILLINRNNVRITFGSTGAFDQAPP